MGTSYVRDKPISVPGRSILAVATIILAAVGGVGTWYYVSMTWDYDCSGSDSRAAPAAASAQAHTCSQLSQRHAEYAFAIVAVLGVVVVAAVAHRWAFERAGKPMLVLSVLLPVVLPYVAYAVVTRPSDDCDTLGRANHRAAVQDWKDDGKQGPRPSECERL